MKYFESYFNTYSPYVDNICIKSIITVVPFLLAWTLFDHHGLSFVIPVESALFCRTIIIIIIIIIVIIIIIIMD
uniref:Conserved domain protein n=1 Tax=Heterorhabditis bacteriophora TaxID=37862 RepID=A0A1I7XUX5_HETBA